jgi:CheY-like chemotaxis protein
MTALSTPTVHSPIDAQAMRTVLYVEDHPVNVLLMQALFARYPVARLVVATTGKEGLALAQAESPDLLLLDVRLPDGNGIQLLQQLRALSALHATPAIAVTAEDTAGLAEAGFVDVWRKPLDMRTTLLRLDRWLNMPVHNTEPVSRYFSNLAL